MTEIKHYDYVKSKDLINKGNKKNMENPSFDKDELLRRVGNNQALFDKLLSQRYMIKEYIDELLECIRSKDEILIKKSAHKLKGAAFGLSFNKMGKFAEEIEKVSNNDLSLAEDIHSDILKEWQYLTVLLGSE